MYTDQEDLANPLNHLQIKILCSAGSVIIWGFVARFVVHSY